MKLYLFLTIIFSSFVYFAQGETKAQSLKGKEWTRIESPSKDFSIAVPPDFVVDKEEGENVSKIYASKNGVGFRVTMELRSNFKEELRRRLTYFKNKRGYKLFESEGFIGMEYLQKDTNENSNLFIELASSNGGYTVNAATKDLTNEDYLRFLYSLRLGNKFFFAQKADFLVEDQSISISSLNTDEIVFKALRQAQSTQSKLEMATRDEKKKIIDDTKYSRELIILRIQRPGYTESARQRRIQGTVRLRVTYLGSGEIGTIKIISWLDPDLDKKAFNAAKKIKFIPAEVDGKPVDVTKFIEYNFILY